MLSIQSPPNAGIHDPAFQEREIRRFKREASADGVNIQKIQNLGCRETRIREIQKVFDGQMNRIVATLPAIGDAERDMPRIIHGDLTEDGFDMGCISINVRDHDDDIAWEEGIRILFNVIKKVQ